MKSVNSFLFVLVVAILMVGCINNNEDISEIKDETELITYVFGTYNSKKETGIVCVNEKLDENDRTYIYYVFKPPSIEKYKQALREYTQNNDSESDSENMDEVISKLEYEAGEEIAPKIKKLYTNKNINKVRIEVGMVWPYGKNTSKKPGEDYIGEKILYIKTFNFTKNNYMEALKEYSKDLKV